jgi:hypothetical protein
VIYSIGIVGNAFSETSGDDSSSEKLGFVMQRHDLLYAVNVEIPG